MESYKRGKVILTQREILFGPRGVEYPFGVPPQPQPGFGPSTLLLTKPFLQQATHLKNFFSGGCRRDQIALHPEQ